MLHKFLLTVSALALLAGCTSNPPKQEVISAPAPVLTPNVQLVKATVFPMDNTITVADAFSQYGLCHPKSIEWREIEPGKVQFSCYFEDLTLIQFDFMVNEKREVGLRQFTFTSQTDAEFSGISVRGEQAMDALKHVYMNEMPF